MIANSLSITIAQRTREFATLRTLGASRRQVLTLDHRSRRSSSASSRRSSGSSLGLGLAKGLFTLFDAVGFTLPNSGLDLRDARRSSCRCSSGSSSRCSRACGRRSARRACRRSPPCARARRCRRRASRGSARSGLDRPDGARLRRAAPAALFGPGLGTTGVLVWMGARRAADLHRRRAALGAARPPARRRARLAGDADRRRRGRARARATRSATRSARRRPPSALMIGLALVTLVAVLAAGIISHVPERRQRALEERRLRDHGAEQLLADPGRGGRSRGQGARRGRGRQRPGGPGEGLRRRSTTPPPSIRRPAEIFALDWKEGSDAVLARLGERRRLRRQGLREDHHLKVGSTLRQTFADGESATFRVLGIFKPPTGGSPFGPVTISAETWDRFNAQPQNLYSFVMMKGGETDANTARARQRVADVPEREGADARRSSSTTRSQG